MIILNLGQLVLKAVEAGTINSRQIEVCKTSYCAKNQTKSKNMDKNFSRPTYYLKTDRCQEWEKEKGKYLTGLLELEEELLLFEICASANFKIIITALKIC